MNQPNPNPKTLEELVNEMDRVIKQWEENAEYSEENYSDSFAQQLTWKAEGMKTAKYLVMNLQGHLKKTKV
jgi:uncharacterized phage protein gp47/JayE